MINKMERFMFVCLLFFLCVLLFCFLLGFFVVFLLLSFHALEIATIATKITLIKVHLHFLISYEPGHVHPGKTQISLRIHAE